MVAESFPPPRSRILSLKHLQNDLTDIFFFFFANFSLIFCIYVKNIIIIIIIMILFFYHNPCDSPTYINLANL